MSGCGELEEEAAALLVRMHGLVEAGEPLEFRCGAVYVPLRTCRLVEGAEGRTECGACGCSEPHLLGAAFCPECGARIDGRWWDDE